MMAVEVVVVDVVDVVVDVVVCSSVASQPAGHGDSLRILQHWSRALSPQDDNVVIYLGHRYKDTEV